MIKRLCYSLIWLIIILSINFIWWWVLAQGKVKPWDAGINLSGDCLMWVWQNCFNYEGMLWLSGSQPGSGYTATSIAQDVVISATYMVWTVLTIVIIVCWLWYIFASASGKGTDKYKKWLISAAIWAILVRWAYAIVRLIQYIARW